MKIVKIPHAKTAFVDQSGFPYEKLIVVTTLPQYSPAGPEADARYDMLKAIATAVAERQLHGGADIRWGVR